MTDLAQCLYLVDYCRLDCAGKVCSLKSDHAHPAHRPCPSPGWPSLGSQVPTCPCPGFRKGRGQRKEGAAVERVRPQTFTVWPMTSFGFGSRGSTALVLAFADVVVGKEVHFVWLAVETPEESGGGGDIRLGGVDFRNEGDADPVGYTQ